MRGQLASGKSVEIRKYRTSLHVKTEDGKVILVDCGPDFAHQVREFGIQVPDAILITHPHLDHIAGLDEINLYKPTGRLPVPVYATEACWNCIKAERGMGYIVKPLDLVTENVLLANFDCPAFAVGSVTVTPFPVEHQHRVAPGAVGFVLEERTGGQSRRILYSGDFWAVSNPANPLFSAVFDIVILECDRWDRLAGPAVGGGHMSFQEALRMLKNGLFANPLPKKVVFVHFGDNGPKGTSSTYQDWRDSIISDLRADGLVSVIPDEDEVIGYEGLTLQV
jgi:phosphoribosyl 1,2-cyclic phosphodiesterase